MQYEARQVSQATINPILSIWPLAVPPARPTWRRPVCLAQTGRILSSRRHELIALPIRRQCIERGSDALGRKILREWRDVATAANERQSI